MLHHVVRYQTGDEQVSTSCGLVVPTQAGESELRAATDESVVTCLDCLERLSDKKQIAWEMAERAFYEKRARYNKYRDAFLQKLARR